MSIFEALKNVKMIVTDVDGTLTHNWLLSCAAVEAVRKLEAAGIKVSLVSSNNAAFLATFAKYLGISGYVVAEGGAVIMDTNFNIVWIAKPEGFDRQKIIEVMESMGFRSVLNEVKYVDVGFFRTEKSANVTRDEILRRLEEAGIRDVEVHDSGYAVHVLPGGVNKANALKKLLEIADLRIDEVLVIGDGDNDIPMFEVAKLTAAPGNATENLKKLAKIVVDEPDGEGFAKIAEMVLRAKHQLSAE